MEEAPENGKESSHSAQVSGMNGIFIHMYIYNIYVRIFLMDTIHLPTHKLRPWNKIYVLFHTYYSGQISMWIPQNGRSLCQFDIIELSGHSPKKVAVNGFGSFRI
jgi:hypothetical protein